MTAIFPLSDDLNNKSDCFSEDLSHEIATTPFHKLLNAIELAKRADEDILYFSFEEFQLDIDESTLEEIIIEVAEKKIYFLYVDVDYDEKMPINERLSVISSIHGVRSFILLRPIFNYITEILSFHNIDNVGELDFFKIIAPHNFLIDVKSNWILPESKIHVISPFRNVEKYILECYNSIIEQKYTNFHIHFINDNSDDLGGMLIPIHTHVSVKENDVRKYALLNIIETLCEKEFDDEDIICIVDGDDKLPHDAVFSIVNSCYKSFDCLMTYGSLAHYNKIRKHGGVYEAIDFENIRNAYWHYFPLRTFKYKVFKEFLKQDPHLNQIKRSDGSFLEMPYDMALFFNLLEITGYHRLHFIDTIMYEYRGHPNNDFNTNGKLQKQGENEVRSKGSLIRKEF